MKIGERRESVRLSLRPLHFLAPKETQTVPHAQDTLPRFRCETTRHAHGPSELRDAMMAVQESRILLCHPL